MKSLALLPETPFEATATTSWPPLQGGK